VEPDADERSLSSRLAGLASLCEAQAPESDRLARLTEPVARGLIDAGLFRIWIPRSCGGSELSLSAALRLYEAAAAIDGSVGWSVMIGAGGGLFAAYLEPAAAREIFAPRAAVIAGSGAPDGRAERVEGGYRVSGRWRYASGAHYASTFTANCVVTRAGQPELDAAGVALIRAMAFAPATVRILPAWQVSGMRGTGSHDFEVTDTFVPERHSFSVFTDAPIERGALYRLPFTVLTELPVTAVALGLAARILREFASLARLKPPGADPVGALRYAEMQAALGLVRTGIVELASRTWERAVSGVALSAQEQAAITGACVHAVAHLRRGAAELLALAGMTAIQSDHPLARAWRDLSALAAHASISPRALID
jgi:alkylation response protein AidB-like acyl-CoA dehydrogenase